MSTPAIDPFAPAFRANPYAAYAWLREHAPLFRTPAGPWLVTRHADCTMLLADARFAHWELRSRGGGGAATRFQRIVGRWLDLMSPANRGRLRTLTSRMFTPARAAALATEAETLARSLAAACAERPRFDVVSDFADPLTLALTARQLGIAATDVPRFAALATRLRGSLFSFLGNGTSGADSDGAASELASLLTESIEAHRTSREDDWLTALFDAREAGEAIDLDDFAALAIVFLFAGHENTTNFISTAAWTLLRHGLPRTSLSDAGIEELLRFVSPVQFVSLTAREPVALEHGTIGAGEQVLVCLASANRDSRAFTTPDELDLDRSPNPHLALGHGPFFCIGASVARMEARAALGALLEIAGGFEIEEGEPVWREGPAPLRGLRELPLRAAAVTARGAA